MKNWQTTLAGLLVGLTGATGVGWQKPDGSVNWIAIAIAVTSALLGLVSKQHNVTGGTIPQTKVAATQTGDSPVGLPGPIPVTPAVDPKE
jgi:hypothetical protein